MVHVLQRVGNWRQALGQWLIPTSSVTTLERPATVPLTRPALDVLAQPDYLLPSFVAACPVAQKYLSLLGMLPWSHFPERPNNRPWPGPTPQPRAPFVAALLVQLVEQKPTLGALVRFLREHAALVWLLGFPLVADPAAPYGFDVAASVPSRRRVGQVLRSLSNEALQWLLDQSVTLIREALPPAVAEGFGQVVSGDTKHILAWVKQNNPKAFIKEGRYDKTRQPSGDRDCKLGVKSRRNASPSAAEDAPASAPTPATDPVSATHLPVGAELYWGYASGILVTKVAGWGEVVLAERTAPFDQSDISYFQPLLADATRRLGFHPPYGAFDAAFDAWYVHQAFHAAGGMAAVPLVIRGKPAHRQFDAAGQLLCEAGLVMPALVRFEDRTTSLVPQPKAKFGCPLRQMPSEAVCPIQHPKWVTGGCTTTMGTTPGARLRYTTDRESETYKALYRQRTADERINSQAVELGIERPKLRNQRSISNRNTLIYVLINLRTLRRIRERRATAPEPALAA